MVFCSSCRKNVPTNYDESGILSCSLCGKVLQFSNFSTETTFVKDKSGQSRVGGTLIWSVERENASRERLFERAYDDLLNIKNGLDMGPNVAVVDQAMVYYRIAVERNFTKGRRTDQVQAACLYIACRENRKPYLLIDFSNYLQINIYVLGAVFLQLCKVLNLTEHAICQKLLDPSIFIHKYTASLSGGKNKQISDDALTIIASMNHHWMQTGRRPSALWGAALYISAISHGLNCSKSDILRLVHVCGKTLSKRLVEFENTESGSLTIEELNAKAEELKESSMPQKKLGEPSSSKELLCQHKGTNKPPFGFGLCKDCYAIVIGFEGGSDPPAFQNAERQRMKLSSITHNVSKESNSQCESRDEEGPAQEHKSAQASMGNLASDPDKLQDDGEGDTSSKAFYESDGFSDIDDAEVDSYLHNEEEKRYKKIIWEEMNREYLQEQEAKEAASATLKEAWEENFKNCPEDLQAAKKLDAAVKAELAKSKKEMQQKRAAEAKNLVPAKSAAEAVHRMLTKKRISSKINYDVLEKLFEEPEAKDAKKLRTESHPDPVEKVPGADGKDHKLEGINENDGSGPLDENEDGAVGEAYDDFLYDENAGENGSDDDYGNSLW
ncbi:TRANSCRIPTION FACTOR IIIB 90 KDA SUBUNIT [Salix purpurea]|uniref:TRANSCRIPTION FACTOR IIIB 90 kDa SUBUNIT n=1 Tax=Salix purpurea TaxID=77065 RepID=A0A9Q0VUK1_SALPP|nr:TRANSCRIPTION FACTOR IIIB 90 KDA SUBUNIT [Salix purpurea]